MTKGPGPTSRLARRWLHGQILPLWSKMCGLVRCLKHICSSHKLPARSVSPTGCWCPTKSRVWKPQATLCLWSETRSRGGTG